MDDTGSEFSWFLAYLFCTVLALGGIVWSAMAWWQRKQKRERRAAKKDSYNQFRAWRDGKEPPPK